ncbi:hypothetical protein [Noviherbaspirillum galbum]|uniref:Uncharacterized protein n=1 Tax=Noviherbaspirillum galbum TaxID=2709383 RepID=A0A6B3SR30_9BURK|nr:hypothetical protein [Noviherbaspirillum galbum]NEX60119.1 hypothetical protein [Noviherbaspirillum galbum]
MNATTVSFPASPNAALYALLASADLVTIDGGPYVQNWDIATETGDPENQVVLFHWENEGLIFTTILTEGGIAAGRLKDECFVCDDFEGEPTIIRFFKVREIKSQSLQGDAPFPVIVHARRLIEKIDRAASLRSGQPAGEIKAEDWNELIAIAGDLRSALGGA